MPAPSSAVAPVTPQHITELAWGFAPAMMLHAAVENKVFDILDGGEKSVPELAAATGASQRGLRPLVNALCAFGILRKKEDKYSLAEDTAKFLVSGKPGYLGGFLGHITGEVLHNWTKLPQSVRTGKPIEAVNQQAGGAEFFSKFVESLFNLNFAGASVLADELAKKYPQLASADAKILDLAAGSGVWSIAMAKRLPNSRITAVDWQEVTPVTRKVAQQHGVADRLSTIDGDIQQVDFGKNFQLALLGHILHSEGPDRSRKLIKRVFDALAPGGIIAIAEFVADDARTQSPFPLIFALNMLVHTQDGDSFTFPEMTAWLQEAGFANPAQIPVPAPSPILIAIKPA